MTPAEFTSRMVGKPWRKWHASWESVDCYGLIVLYFREVLGVELGNVPQTDIAAGFSRARGWEECEPVAGATCFMAWLDGAPSHCGVLINPLVVLHSEGSEQHGGSVRTTRLTAMRRVYGALKFYRYNPC